MRRFIQQKAIIYALIFTLIGSFAMPSIAMALQIETRVLICTSQGYQWVTVTDDQASNFNSNGSQHCSYCLTSDDDQDLQFENICSDFAKLSTRSTFRYDFTELGLLGTLNALARAPPLYI